MKKRVFLLCICLFLTVTCSFSWILDSTIEPPTKTLEIDYRGYLDNNHLSVYDLDGFSMEILQYNDEAKDYLPVASGSILSSANMLPGNSLRFKIRLRNTTGNTETMKLFITDFSTPSSSGIGNSENIDSIYDHIYLSVIAGDGYIDPTNVNVTKPEWIFMPLSELASPASDNTHVVYSALCVPYTPGDEYVELECRFWLDVNSTGLEGLTVLFGKFVLSL